MALRFSTALRNAVGSGLSWNEALSNGKLEIYTGTQPADADIHVEVYVLVCAFSHIF